MKKHGYQIDYKYDWDEMINPQRKVSYSDKQNSNTNSTLKIKVRQS